MTSPVEFFKSLFRPEVVDTVKAPVGAWIAPVKETGPNIAFDKGRPVMDAAYAHAHNEQLFSGMLSWGPVMALALVGLAVVWTKFLRH